MQQRWIQTGGKYLKKTSTHCPLCFHFGSYPISTADEGEKRAGEVIRRLVLLVQVLERRAGYGWTREQQTEARDRRDAT